ncbi:aldo/keto reductase [Paenibacillus pseudetheri]|uniref:Aldo-keto reductase YhdN n=1 Tax=Paenibacillus pseudetheri TaxID=2897682 RepID=A0ABN8FRA1_9BACL|nr:aldo/keto reductase [Paenibacillus pseudetheri]CAH1058972.1 Aldo-keto reductase YhdN [Paenibacillus pseudetheri]
MDYCRIAGVDTPLSRIGLGCGSLFSSNTWGYQDPQQSHETIISALREGVNFFDTAESYASGWAEELLRTTIRQNIARHQVVIATKASGGHLSEYSMESACDASLCRLKTDYIDLYQVHWPAENIPVAETLGALQKLKEKGKIRSYGVCNFGASLLTQIPDVCMPSTNQLPYNLLWRAIETGLQSLCAGKGIGIITYSSLAQGLLTGKFQNANAVPGNRARTRLFSSDRERARHHEPGFEHLVFLTLDQLKELSRESGISMAHLSLAWLLSFKGITSVLVGARSSGQIKANADASEIHLRPETQRRLEEITHPLKTATGGNVDLWQTESRII